MNEFNMLVLHIATIVFIIVLAIVGIILYYSINNGKFPPYNTTCPTYYKLDPSGNYCTLNNDLYPASDLDYPNNVVPNTPDTGDCIKTPITTFYQSGYTDSDILCKKKQWANKCGVYWDGVTNNSDACSKYHNNLFSN